MLTLKKLETLEEGIFLTGEVQDGPEGINLSNSGKQLRWVACRGTISDWCIYAHFSDHSAECVAQMGDKVLSEEHIKRLVNCDEEAFNRYRR